MIITAEKCRECLYTCKCCSARDNAFESCSSCSKDYDKFIPAQHIKHCPRSGDKIENYFATHCVVMGHGVEDRRKMEEALQKFFNDHKEFKL